MPSSASLLRPAITALAAAICTAPALSAPAMTLDVLHQDLIAIKEATLAVSPAKPSDVVITKPFTEQCANGLGSRISTRHVPGGESQPFVIPAGSAYMVTGVSFASTIQAGQWARFVLRQEGYGSVVGEGSMLNTLAVPAPMVTHVAFPSPIRFTTAAACIDLDGSNASTRLWVYGFLVKDQ